MMQTEATKNENRTDVGGRVDQLVMRLRQHALPDPHDEREVLHAPLLKAAANRITELEDMLDCGPHICKSSAPPAGSIAWSNERPTAPGWWWYEDEYYGPAPLYLAWTGFIKRPGARELSVDMAVGEDQEILGQQAADLGGAWFPLQEPPLQEPPKQ